MYSKVPSTELNSRMDRFRMQMDKDNPDWDFSAIFGNINLYYLTGTIQDGVLLVPRDGEATLWVRKSYERALAESEFPRIQPMKSFRDAAGEYLTKPDEIFIETGVVPVALLERFQKHFPCRRVRSLDNQIAKVRAEKSEYELIFMEQAGEIHRRVLEDLVPDMLREGMSEAELVRDIYSSLIEEGHHAIVRFGMFNTEILVGQIGFGESSIYPTYFDGPGGCYGMSPAVPTFGSRHRRLKRGDLVFVDNACGVNGYHTDKTMTYMFGSSLPDTAIEVHHQCLAVQDRIAELLKPGMKPSWIYETVMDEMASEIPDNFMGYGNRRVSFLGHGTGLQVDEQPVIAKGFDDPLVENMTIALEPKAGITGIGMVGTENTFVVTMSGGRVITGKNRGLIPVY